MVSNIKLGANIKIRRKELGLSIAQLSTATNIDKNVLKKYEIGMEENPSFDVLSVISKVLLVDIDWLTGKTEVRRQPVNAYSDTVIKEILDMANSLLG